MSSNYLQAVCLCGKSIDLQTSRQDSYGVHRCDECLSKQGEMSEQAPKIDPAAIDGGRLYYDKESKTIKSEGSLRQCINELETQIKWYQDTKEQDADSYALLKKRYEALEAELIDVRSLFKYEVEHRETIQIELTGLRQYKELNKRSSERYSEILRQRNEAIAKLLVKQQEGDRMLKQIQELKTELAKYRTDGKVIVLENRIMELEGELDKYKQIGKPPKPCVKCGHSDIHTDYHATKYDCSYGCHGKIDGEHLHYYCRNCSYDWAGPILPPEEE